MERFRESNIRHAVRGRLAVRGVTPRRLAAARRAIQRERDKLALFVHELISEQESPEERISRFDLALIVRDQQHRDLAARHWRWGRARLAELNETVRGEIVAAWNKSSIPPQPCYFADFVRNQLRKRAISCDS